MNEDTIEGAVKSGAGKVEAKVGNVLDDPKMEASGDSRQIEGKVQDVIGTVQDAISQAADRVAATASTVGDQARTAYSEVTVRVQKVVDEVDPFVKDRPYAAVGFAAAAGLLFGLLFAGRGPKVIYVRPRV